MKTRVTKTKITFTDIANESQLEMIREALEESKCKGESSDFSTKVVITGDLNKFIERWNKILSA